MSVVEKLSVKSSNGSSFVFISPEKNNVYQYFSNSKTVYKIIKILKKILKVNIQLTFKNNIVEYNLYDFICQFISYKPNIIIWKKHICLNFFDKEKIKKIINDNIVKLIWDIGKSLYALHENNISHRDARIDNIGILNGNFILFDFDGSSLNVSNKDVYDFVVSIKFNLGDLWNNVKHNIPENNCNSYDFINNIIKIQQRNMPNCNIINKLNNLKII